MKKRLLVVIGASILLAHSLKAQATPAAGLSIKAQAAPAAALSIPEFRQVLVDLGTYLDARKGTNLASKFSAMSDETLGVLYSGLANPAQLKSSVEALKNSDALAATGATPMLSRRAIARRLDVPASVAVAGSCQPGSIIDNSPNSTCIPDYPDPTNTDWQNMVNPIMAFGAFPATDTTYNQVSSQQCGLSVESNLVQTVAALNGTVTVAAIVCSALPPVVSNVCDGGVAVVGTAGAIAQGLLSDCDEQDGDVNSAEIDAGFLNTVTIFNALEGVSATVNTMSSNIGSDNTTLSNILGNTTSIQTFLGTLNSNVLSVGNNEASIGNGLTNQITSLGNGLTNQINGVDNDVNHNFQAINNNLANQFQGVNANVAGVNSNLSTTSAGLNLHISSVDSDVLKTGTGLSTQIAGVDTDLMNRATQIDNEIAADSKLNLRLFIETNLAADGGPVGLFEVPQSQGGYLEMAEAIVADIIAKMTALGQNVHNAQQQLNNVSSDVAAKNYQKAYQDLKQAYSSAAGN